MKFKDMPYERPDLAKLTAELDELAKKAASSETPEAMLQCFTRFQAIRNDVETAQSLCHIRHTVDTRDEFYDGETDYFDENSPILSDKYLNMFRAILASPQKAALQEKYGNILLAKMEIDVESASEATIPLQQKENALSTRYQKLYASAKIPFDGKELTVAQLQPYKQHTDRAVRKAAMEAEGGFFDSHREELDDIFDQLVKNRAEQAKILGYESFVPLGDVRMGRIGYNRKDITAFREGVATGIVPGAQKLAQLQKERINVDRLMAYDAPLSFPDGNPKPQGTPEEILAAGQKMYRELSAETAEFIDFMMDNGLFDVLATPGKGPGGYCIDLPNYQSPFIFSNFNGTAADVDVLTHEAGHAFAAYLAGRMNLPSELRIPGMESCEIHSMAMEFLTNRFHHLFFGDDNGKYQVSHAEDAMFFMPYGCQVDEFQERIYSQPDMTPDQRNELWLTLERKYRPWMDFGDLPFYSRGAGWQRQMHIYEIPFYYIDYVMAQVVALEFFLANNESPQKSWEQYLALVRCAGTKTYPELVSAAGFPSSFDQSNVQRIGEAISQWIAQHPCSKA